MDFEAGPAVVAGLVGGGVLAAVLYTAMAMMPRHMKMNLFMLLGSMVLPVGVGAFVMGAMVHAVMSAVFGLVHAAVFSIAGIESSHAAWGLLFGLAHWAIAGMALGMLPLVHPRVRYSGRRLVPAAGTNPHPQELLDPPGAFALGYPPLTVAGFLMLHLMFGAVFGALYGAWA